MEAHYILCEVLNESLCVMKIQTTCAMAKICSCWLLTMDTCIEYQATPWNLRWTKWQWDRFLSGYFSFLLWVSFHQCSTLIFIGMLQLKDGQVGETWELW